MGHRKEVVIIPSYQRNEYLWCALRRIREQDRLVDILVFSDRSEDNPEFRLVCHEWEARMKWIPKHDYFGNSYCVLEALRWAFEQRYDLIHVNEDDAMQHPDCLAWHREVHAEHDFIFASCGWVFNLYAPITDDLAFAPWFYAPNYSINTIFPAQRCQLRL